MLNIIVGVFAVAVAGYYGIKFLSKKADENICSDFESWTINAVANLVKEKISASEGALVSVMNGNKNPILEAELNQAVDAVTVEFSKDSSNILVCVVVSYKDGSIASVKKQMNWESIPSEIREKFLRAGDASIHTEWNFSFFNGNIGDD